MQRAMGISIHTGWAACVVVGGSLAKPEIVANEVIEILGDSERFCFHMAAEMKRAAAKQWIARAKRKAVANARQALAPLVAKEVRVCAIVAKDGEPPGSRRGARFASAHSHGRRMLLSRRVARGVPDSGARGPALNARSIQGRKACVATVGTGSEARCARRLVGHDSVTTLLEREVKRSGLSSSCAP